MDDFDEPWRRDPSPEARLIERFLAFGPGDLSTAELLAILLRAGTEEESAAALAERMMKEMGSLKAIVQSPTAVLSRIEGVGSVKAVEIKAALELGKRMLALGDGVRPAIHAPADAAGLVMAELRYEPQEHFKVLMLDAKNQVLRSPTITIGTVNASLIHPREVFRPALLHPCASIILAHNHPSGDPTPSREDLDVTKQLVAAGKVLGIDVLDHVIVGDARFVSLKERGLM